MITNYFKSVVLRIPPTGHSAKLGRVFLANLPPRARADVKVDFKLLALGAKPELKVTFKDGTTIAADMEHTSTGEMLETFDRQSRQLQIRDTINE